VLVLGHIMDLEQCVLSQILLSIIIDMLPFVRRTLKMHIIIDQTEWFALCFSMQKSGSL